MEGKQPVIEISSDDEPPPKPPIDLTYSSEEEAQPSPAGGGGSQGDLETKKAREQDEAERRAAEVAAAAEAQRNAAAAAEAERKPAAAASYSADQRQASLSFAEGVRVIDGSETIRVTSIANLAARGQRVVTAAPGQGAAGGVAGNKVVMSGAAAEAERKAAQTESDSDDDQDKAPIPAMELKQKAADVMGGSAQKRKPKARSAAKPTETEPRAGTTAAKKQKKRKWHATVKDRRWISDVEAWFAEKQREFKWLNIDELEAATVDLMIQMESDEIRACMADCLKKRAVELNMHVFNKVLQGGLK